MSSSLGWNLHLLSNCIALLRENYEWEAVPFSNYHEIECLFNIICIVLFYTEIYHINFIFKIVLISDYISSFQLVLCTCTSLIFYLLHAYFTDTLRQDIL